jgi:hypothetical protein
MIRIDDKYRMKIKAKWWIIFVVALLVTGIGIWILRNANIVETIKKETAKILVYEYIPNQNVNLETCLAVMQKDSIYADFRKSFRFHYQTVAVATFPDSSRLVLISEPPPYFEIDSLKTIFQKFTHSVENQFHKIGYDGYITDILIIIGNATQENMQNLLKRLSKELYLSDYKPQICLLPTTSPRIYFSEQNLDYQISLYEFNEWFLENEETFIRLEDTTKKETVKSILEYQKHGVWFSEQPGFVAWAIAKNSDLKEQQQYIRQFTLDADLILGALADSATLVIIGREREASLQTLPPLNVESILLLASITEKELSQSLDVNDFLAGKMANGKDWCPTYLSKELENTEFGHLMTITDILLKNWSENGTIQEAYYRYPRPPHYPFDKPLFKKLGLNELVYNWNTANAMYAIDLKDVTIYTLNRTGSLPVSYFNSQERSVSVGSRFENQAYHYFATCGNTDLARVVQYTALYQLFIDNKIHYSEDVYTEYPNNKPFLLLNPVKNMLNIFKNLTDKQIDYLIDTLTKIQFHEYIAKQVDEQLDANEKQSQFVYSADIRQQIHQNVQKDTKQQLFNDFSNVKTMLNSLSEDNFTQLTRFLAYPRGCQVRSQADYNIYLKAKICNRLMRSVGKNHLPLLGVDLEEVKNFFVNHLANSSAKYLKTPSVIITFNDFLTTGGHNLSSKISRVKSLTNYKKNHYISPTPQEPTNKQPIVETSSDKTPETSPSKNSPQVGNFAKPSLSNVKTTPSPNTAKQAIRSRGAVISTAPRVQRGL